MWGLKDWAIGGSENSETLSTTLHLYVLELETAGQAAWDGIRTTIYVAALETSITPTKKKEMLTSESALDRESFCACFASLEMA